MNDSLLIAVLLVCSATAFVKIATTLTVFRYGVGLQGIEFGFVTLLVSLVIAMATLPEPLRQLNMFGNSSESPSAERVNELLSSLSPVLESKTDAKIQQAFEDKVLATADASKQSGRSENFLRSVLPAFLVSEVKLALTLGVTLLVPFLLIDLLIAHILTLLGVQQIAVATVALPVKLAVFLSVNGWELLVGKLILN